MAYHAKKHLKMCCPTKLPESIYNTVSLPSMRSILQKLAKELAIYFIVSLSTQLWNIQEHGPKTLPVAVTSAEKSPNFWGTYAIRIHLRCTLTALISCHTTMQDWFKRNHATLRINTFYHGSRNAYLNRDSIKAADYTEAYRRCVLLYHHNTWSCLTDRPVAFNKTKVCHWGTSSFL